MYFYFFHPRLETMLGRTFRPQIIKIKSQTTIYTMINILKYIYSMNKKDDLAGLDRSRLPSLSERQRPRHCMAEHCGVCNLTAHENRSLSDPIPRKEIDQKKKIPFLFFRKKFFFFLKQLHRINKTILSKQLAFVTECYLICKQITEHFY